MRPPRVPGPLLAFLLVAACVASFAQAPREPREPSAAPAVRQALELAGSLRESAEYSKALAAAERALGEAQGTGDAVGEAAAHRMRARLLVQLSRTGEAVEAWRKAVAAWERAGDGPGCVEALAGAAVLLIPGEPGPGRELLKRALERGASETRRPLAAGARLSQAGLAFYRAALLSEARDCLSAGLALIEKAGPETAAVALNLHQLAVVAHLQGDLAAAEAAVRRSLRIREKLDPESLIVASTLNRLGTVLLDRGDLAEGREHLERALGIREKLAPDSLILADSLKSLGDAAIREHDFTAAGVYLRRALAIQERLAPAARSISVTLSSLAHVVVRGGDLGEAEALQRRAHGIVEQIAPRSMEAAISLQNLAAIAQLKGDAEAAREHAERAVAILETVAPGSPQHADGLSALGHLLQLRGDTSSARKVLERAVQYAERTAPGSDGLASILINLSYVARDEDKINEAETLARSAWELLKSHRDRLAGDAARMGFAASQFYVPGHLIGMQVRLGRVREAYATLEESRAQALRAMIAERNLDERSADPRLWSAYQAAAAERDRREGLAAQAGLKAIRAEQEAAAAEADGADAAALVERRRLRDAAAQAAEAERSEAVKARQHADRAWAAVLKGSPRALLPALDPAAALQALPEGATFAAFAVGDQETVLFLARGGRAPTLQAFRIRLPWKQLRDRSHRFAAAASSGSPGVAAEGRALFSRLFPDEAGRAVRESRRVIVSPDGPLWSVPFAALVPSPEGALRYLGEDCRITYIQSLTLLAARGNAPTPNTRPQPAVLAVGDPVFERAPAQPPTLARRSERAILLGGRAPAPLPGSAAEAAGVSQVYGAAPLTGTRATEAAIRTAAGGADMIHLATHGFYLAGSPMSSGMLLAWPGQELAAGDTENDGVLQAWEIFRSLKLRADLVVLSACDSGQGDLISSEGLIGLTRAFQYAGARSIIASRWKVPDESTARFMLQLHRALRRGAAKDEALWEAGAVLRKESRTAHPHFWAAFFLTGDPENHSLGRR